MFGWSENAITRNTFAGIGCLLSIPTVIVGLCVWVAFGQVRAANEAVKIELAATKAKIEAAKDKRPVSVNVPMVTKGGKQFVHRIVFHGTRICDVTKTEEIDLDPQTGKPMVYGEIKGATQ